MKKILPVLLCYVLSTSQTFALSGGPVFGGGTVNPLGQYSGIIEGVTETDDTTTAGPAIPGDPLPSPTNTNTSPSNALGLFNLSVPQTSSATGGFLLFEDGIVFTGTITASADPDSGKLIGILEASFLFTLNTFDSTGNVVTSQVGATAVGRINAKVSGGRVGGGSSLGRLTGTANLDVSFGEVSTTTLQPIVARSTTFNVVGFKQSNSPTGSLVAPTTTG